MILIRFWHCQGATILSSSPPPFALVTADPSLAGVSVPPGKLIVRMVAVVAAVAWSKLLGQVVGRKLEVALVGECIVEQQAVVALVRNTKFDVAGERKYEAEVLAVLVVGSRRG